MVYLAEKTIALIDKCMEEDEGSKYRIILEKVLPHIGDAYCGNNFPFRSHLGASIIGKDCAREIWYGFRWAALPRFEGRILRLFNRGHLEEGRFIALLLMAGIQVYQQDEHGNQFRISDAQGHFGGSGDGIAIGIPDVVINSQILLEFKTHNDKNFKKLKNDGVRESKFVHFVQTQIYMRKMGLANSLYLAVNKNDDHLYGEIIPIDTLIADEFIQRGINLVWMQQPPRKINESPGWYACKWCNFYDVCHKNESPFKSCRSCTNGYPIDDGMWECRKKNSSKFGELATPNQQLEGCPKYSQKF